jgi:hypothetical protein
LVRSDYRKEQRFEAWTLSASCVVI